MPIELGSFSFGVVAGGAVVGVINHLLTISRITEERKIKDFNQAAAEFRCAFTDEIRLVEDSTKDTDFTKIFDDGYIRHYNAMIRFQAYLSESDRVEMKKAWDEHCWDGYLDQRESVTSTFLHYQYGQDQERVNGKFRITEETEVAFERAKQLVNKNLENIFSFAKFK